LRQESGSTRHGSRRRFDRFWIWRPMARGYLLSEAAGLDGYCAFGTIRRRAR
jgi:hypothetical protein